MMERDQFRLNLRCPHCDALGAATWEENSFANPKGVERKLIQVHGDFHSEAGRTKSGDPVVVCNACDTIQQD